MSPQHFLSDEVEDVKRGIKERSLLLRKLAELLPLLKEVTQCLKSKGTAKLYLWTEELKDIAEEDIKILTEAQAQLEAEGRRLQQLKDRRVVPSPGDKTLYDVIRAKLSKIERRIEDKVEEDHIRPDELLSPELKSPIAARIVKLYDDAPLGVEFSVESWEEGEALLDILREEAEAFGEGGQIMASRIAARYRQGR